MIYKVAGFTGSGKENIVLRNADGANISLMLANPTSTIYVKISGPADSSAGAADSGGSGLSAGAIAGIAVGCAVAVAVAATAAWAMLRSRRLQGGWVGTDKARSSLSSQLEAGKGAAAAEPPCAYGKLGMSQLPAPTSVLTMSTHNSSGSHSSLAMLCSSAGTHGAAATAAAAAAAPPASLPGLSVQMHRNVGSSAISSRAVISARTLASPFAAAAARHMQQSAGGASATSGSTPSDCRASPASTSFPSRDSDTMDTGGVCGAAAVPAAPELEFALSLVGDVEGQVGRGVCRAGDGRRWGGAVAPAASQYALKLCLLPHQPRTHVSIRDAAAHPTAGGRGGGAAAAAAGVGAQQWLRYLRHMGQ